MTRAITTTFTLTTALLASQAHAHAGHLADVAGAGHDHWIALGALGAAAAIGLWAGLKGRKKDQDEQADAEDTPAEDDLQEA